MPFAPMGIHPAQALGFGVSPLTTPLMGIPPVPAPFLSMPPLGVPSVPAPFLGVPPLGVHPAQALGFGMQTAHWPITGLGGHAISPVAATLLSQLGLREAVSRIGDDALKQRVITGINEALDRTIEGVSGMGLHPWFGPGAQFMIYPIAAELALLAQRYQEGEVRNALLTIAGQILNKSIAPTGEHEGKRRG